MHTSSAVLTLWCHEGFNFLATHRRACPAAPSEHGVPQWGQPEEMHKDRQMCSPGRSWGHIHMDQVWACLRRGEGHTQLGGQKEEKPRSFSGKNIHGGECGNIKTHSSSLGKSFSPHEFHWIQRSCTSRKIRQHLHPNTISGSTICAVWLYQLYISGKTKSSL